MITRRDWLRSATTATAALTVSPRLMAAIEAPSRSQDLITRAIPKSGEQLPIVGLGSSASFSRMARDGDTERLGEVLRTLVEGGGSVFDTAPSYGASEEVAGGLASELGLTDRIFWATKVNVARRGGGGADPEAARAQLTRSFERIGKDAVDLIQVHNLGDLATQMPIIQEMKEEGRIRYIGTTLTPRGPRYEGLLQAMHDYPIDFIGVDYAVDNTDAADEVLPMAQAMGIGVLVYVPFGRTSLFRRVGDREVPDWAQEFGAETWAQFFIKFAAAHPAVTVVTPATSNPEHMVDNLGAGRGRLPDEDEQARMMEFIAGLPEAN